MEISHINDTHMSWEDAKATCDQEMKGTRLAIINEQNMYQAIADMTNGRNHWLAAFKAQGNERKWRWINENDRTTEFGNFNKWDTINGQPNDGGSEKRCLAQGTDREWYAMGCWEKYYPLCQIPQKGNCICSF